MTGDLQTVAARGGRAVFLGKGQCIDIINVHGEQVVDTWAFVAGEMDEFMAMDATRAYNLRLCPRVGDRLVTNRRRPILTLVRDDSSGTHDTLMTACDRWRYRLLGVEGVHDNCSDNLHASLAELGLVASHTPSPLNLFMNIPWTEDGALSFDPPDNAPGVSVTLRAELDCIVAMSACPQDLLPVNGLAGRPTEVQFRIHG